MNVTNPAEFVPPGDNQEHILLLRSKYLGCHIVMQGDPTGLTAHFKNYKANDDPTYLLLEEDLNNTEDDGTLRTSHDNTVNSHGNMILHVCKPNGLRVCYGRLFADKKIYWKQTCV